MAQLTLQQYSAAAFCQNPGENAGTLRSKNWEKTWENHGKLGKNIGKPWILRGEPAGESCDFLVAIPVSKTKTVFFATIWMWILSKFMGKIGRRWEFWR
jgi:hypothetical protein